MLEMSLNCLLYRGMLIIYSYTQEALPLYFCPVNCYIFKDMSLMVDIWSRNVYILDMVDFILLHCLLILWSIMNMFEFKLHRGHLHLTGFELYFILVLSKWF